MYEFSNESRLHALASAAIGVTQTSSSLQERVDVILPGEQWLIRSEYEPDTGLAILRGDEMPQVDTEDDVHQLPRQGAAGEHERLEVGRGREVNGACHKVGRQLRRGGSVGLRAQPVYAAPL